MYKKAFLYIICMQSTLVFAWQGNTLNYIQNRDTLQLSAPQQVSTSYLSKQSNISINANWQCKIKLDFIPSSVNYARFYLMSSNTDLSTSVEGYFVQVGGSNKTVSLCKQNGERYSTLVKASDDILTSNINIVHLDILRSSEGEFSVKFLVNDSSLIQLPDTADLTYMQSVCYGIYSKYTKTRSNKFRFYDISAAGDEYIMPTPPEIGEIIINEILFNPIGEGSDFVELYNNSTDTINLQTLKLANANDTIDLPNYELPPNEYVALTTNAQWLTDEYNCECYDCILQLPDMPSYNNDEGKVVLLSQDNSTLDSLVYSETMHHALIDDAEGISLERINFDSESFVSASVNVVATPGFKNSQYQIVSNQTQSNESVYLSKEYLTPNGDGIDDNAFINYRLPSGCVANVSIYTLQGLEIKELCNNELLSTKGFIVWNGLDGDDKVCRPGIYIVKFEAVSEGSVIVESLPIVVGL